MDRLLHYYFNLDYMAQSLPALLGGLLVTIEIAAWTIVGGLALGLALAMLRAFRIRTINFFIICFVDIFRALPPLVVIFMVYFALPYAGITMSPFWCATVTLILNMAAVAEEVFWAGIVSVHRGQWEAARSTGVSFFWTLTLVVMPQGVRLAIPPLTNKMISITKMTALASVVAVPELLNQASTEQGVFANPSPLTLGAILFILLFAPLVLASRWVERRYRWQR
jgi:polar amino acid transport system permease protein